MSATGKVKGLIANLVMIEPEGAVRQNEICFLETAGDWLMGEVIKIEGDTIYVQIYDSTRGVRIGDKVTFTGSMLEVTLGPGMLSRKYDGLQSDLDELEGTFLQRGQRSDALDMNRNWDFKPLMKTGEEVVAGAWLGVVEENGLPHRIMAPFDLKGHARLLEMAAQGTYKVTDTIATIELENGERQPLTMINKWPSKLAMKAYKQKLRPFKLLETGIRTIDTLHPMLEGGTGFIPGPFGCGKTVLQQAIAKQAKADVVIVAACGERANEVVEIFTEFPELDDPSTGRKLIERTIIIANTSSMPVAAREASVYTAMTIGEYYRSMGLRVLLLADSTSRWAQALREMSNRLEELPGPDAFPMDLTAVISSFYARAGYVTLNNDEQGSITFIGTVSPAGGNLKEPVTEATKKAARCFYALEQRRADSKRYPAVDPIDSYSKYLEYPEFQSYASSSVGKDWISNALEIKNVMLRGKEAADQINILGDDGVSIDFHVEFWKSEMLDFILLQQDAFDDVDMFTPIHRQAFMSSFLLDISRRNYTFNHFSEVRPFFRKLINTLKQLNYAEEGSDAYEKLLEEAKEVSELNVEVSNI
jgi:V/A-type H+/Na+-transporting ATPase subunit A